MCCQLLCPSICLHAFFKLLLSYCCCLNVVCSLIWPTFNCLPEVFHLLLSTCFLSTNCCLPAVIYQLVFACSCPPRYCCLPAVTSCTWCCLRAPAIVFPNYFLPAAVHLLLFTLRLSPCSCTYLAVTVSYFCCTWNPGRDGVEPELPGTVCPHHGVRQGHEVLGRPEPVGQLRVLCALVPRHLHRE